MGSDAHWFYGDDVTDEGFSSSEPAFKWEVGALCAATDPEIFFPKNLKSPEAKQARSVCNHCVSLDECREYALSDPKLDGIWAGMSRRERRKAISDRRKEDVPVETDRRRKDRRE